MNQNFIRFWVAQISVYLGSRITRQIIPIAAITTLGADAANIGLLHALLFSPAVFVGLYAGTIVNRFGRVRSLRSALLLRAIILASAPTLHMFDLLTWWPFCFLVAAYGACYAFSEISERSLVPDIVNKDQLVGANSRLASTEAVAEICGPLVMGALLAFLLPTTALIADVVCLVFAFFLVGRIRTMPASVEQDSGSSPGSFLTTWRFLLQHVEAHRLVLVLVASTFGNEWMRVVYTIHAIQDVGLTPFQLGLTFSVGGIGLLVGSLLMRIPFEMNEYKLMICALAINSFGLALFPMASLECCAGISWLILGQFISDVGLISFLILARSKIQSTVIDHFVPHVFSFVALCSGVAIALSALGGGIVANQMGASFALFIPPLVKLLGATLLVSLTVQSNRQRSAEAHYES